MWEFEQVRNEKLAARVVKNFEARGFEASYAATKEEAKEKALSYIRTDDVIGWGGCFSAEDAGLMDELRSGRLAAFRARKTPSPPDRKEPDFRQGEQALSVGNEVQHLAPEKRCKKLFRLFGVADLDRLQNGAVTVERC